MSTPKLKPATTYSGVLGAVLAQHRGERPQAELAQAIGLSQSAWSRVENGVTAPTIEQLALAASALRTTPGRLVSDTDAAVASLRKQGVKVAVRRDDSALEGAVVILGLAALAALVIASTGGD